MAMDDNLKYALETVGRIASKNTESRIAKNLDFLFGENYSKYGEFRRAVDDLFTKIIPSSDGKETLKVPHRERMDIINEKLNAFDIGNSKEAYEAYDNMMGYVKTGLYRTSPFSLRGNGIFDEVVKRAKEQGLLDEDIRTLFETTIENAKHYGVYNSDWEISSDIYDAHLPNSASKEVKRTRRQKDREYRINDDIVNDYKEELAKIQAEQRSLNLEMEYEGKTPERLARFEELQTRAHTLIETINHRTGNFTLEEFRAADGDINKLNQLQLNPPREGAPMFEGLAVPSDLVDENGNVIAGSNTMESGHKPESNTQPEVLNNTNDIDLDELNKQWYENKQKEFAERELEIQKEFSDVNTLKPEDIMVNTVEETIENATETVINNTAGEVIEETVEKIIKETTGINTELDVPKRKTPKKLRKGTGKYKGKGPGELYDRLDNSRYWAVDFPGSNGDFAVHGPNGTRRLEKESVDQQRRRRQYEKTKEKYQNKNNYADDIKKKLKEIDSWSDDYIRGLSEEDIINYSDNGEVFEKLYDRWNELNSSADTNTNTNTSGDNKQTKQNKQKTKNVFDDYAEWKEASDVLDYTNPEKYYYTGNYRFDTNPETGIPDIDQYKKHTRNLEEIGYDVPKVEGVDADGKPIKGDTRQVRPNVDMPDGIPAKTGISKYLDDFKNMGFLEKVMTLGNVAGAVSDYKNARREGHGVVSSAVRAGTEFAIGEALGLYYPLYLLAKEAPGLVIQGTEMLYKENRKMNSAANQQVFGGAQFQDTQQLATMRQSGMEMAKMAQYNLQQTLMGQEATYLHR